MMKNLLVHAPTGVGPDVRLEEGREGFRLVANRSLDRLATGAFDRPSRFVSFRPVETQDQGTLCFGGYSYTQFGLPVHAGPALDFVFGHGVTLLSPRVAFPLFAALLHGEEIAECLLLAPLDHFHEQILAVVDGELRWGWHGDLDRVPSGFATELGVFAGGGPRELLSAWGTRLRERSGVSGADRYADPSTSHLSYWTDNGAAYWYRREPGLELGQTLEAKSRELRDLGVPCLSYELDSWFYEHEKTRPIDEIGYLDAVPPTGMLRWEPRQDILAEGLPGLRSRLGDPPLILHSRHISAASPYLEEAHETDWWVRDGLAHPADPRFFRRWFRDAASWGATCYEQDWLWVSFFGVRALREAPDRARQWQRGLDAAAEEFGLSLLWCMATPADFAQATELERVVAIRTCDDYRYAEDPAFLWNWFLLVNALARGLSLWPFKDVFFSAPGEGIDGDPHPEIEALLSALSAGPVGIGDRIGRTDLDLIRRTCRADGLLVKPDRPLAASDVDLFGGARRGERALVADAASGATRYVVGLHVSEGRESVRARVDLGGDNLLYDWRDESARVADHFTIEVEFRDWDLKVVCPLVEGVALIGDPSLYATMGDRRIERRDVDVAEVFGVPGERVSIRWWTAEDGLRDGVVEIPSTGSCMARLDTRD